ncbi:MAG: hypothetical protein ACKVPY_13750 [Paracoccaceae bacterium]
MPEGKSKHPGLIKAATQNVASLKSQVSKAGPALKGIVGAATGLKSAVDSSEKAFKDQLGYCEKVIEKYATKVNEIAEIEEDLKGAKGDKKAEAEILKKHKKADGEADELREEYNTAVQVFETLSDVINEATEAVTAAVGKFEGFSAGGGRG